MRQGLQAADGSPHDVISQELKIRRGNLIVQDDQLVQLRVASLTDTQGLDQAMHRLQLVAHLDRVADARDADDGGDNPCDLREVLTVQRKVEDQAQRDGEAKLQPRKKAWQSIPHGRPPPPE